VPQVLKEILHWPTTKEIQVITEANNGGMVLLAECRDVPLSHDDNGQESISTPHQQKGKQQQRIQLQEALIELCWAVYVTWIDEDDEDLTRQFNEVAAKICSGQEMPHKTFRELVGEARHKLWEMLRT
jgi:hypothetical protein